MNSVKVLLLISTILPSQSEIYSLYYTYRAISKSHISGDIYEFYNSIELSDVQVNYCNSVNKAKFLTKLCTKSKRLFKNESDELSYKLEWLQINLNTLMMRHMRNENRTNDTDLHVLQWRHGCAVERHSNGSVIFLRGTDEYAYDGKNLTFNLSMRWNESVCTLERRCVETLTSFIDLQRERKFITAGEGGSLLCDVIVISLIVVSVIVLTFYQLIKYRHRISEKLKKLKTPLQVELSRPETHAGLAAALNDSSDEENTADDSMEEVQTEELHETQSLCEAKETPAAAPTAARGTMGSKEISLPNFAMEREDTDQNSVTQNALRLALIQRCRFKNISMPNLALQRKDTSDSS